MDWYEEFEKQGIYEWEDISVFITSIQRIKLTGKAVYIISKSFNYKCEYIFRYLSSYNITPIAFIILSGHSNIYRNKDVNIQIVSISESDYSTLYNSIFIWVKPDKEYLELGRKQIVKFLYQKSIYNISNYITKKKLGLKNSDVVINFEVPFYRKRGEEITTYFMKHKDRLEYVRNILADNESIETFKEILRCAYSNDIYRKPEHSMRDKYFECYKHLDDEYFVNCGSCNGDTILWYLMKEYSFKKIDGYESNRIFYNIAKKNIYSVNKNNKITIYNQYIGTGNQANKFDALYENTNVSLINMDIEGAELSVLSGALNLIARCRPVIAIAAYHKASDILEIPQMINSIATGYNYYLRKYTGCGPEYLNEYIYYCVPDERKL